MNRPIFTRPTRAQKAMNAVYGFLTACLGFVVALMFVYALFIPGER